MGRLISNYNLRYLALFLILTVTLLLTWFFTRNSTSPSDQGQKSLSPFNGGKYEASGLIDVEGTDGVFFVDNKRDGHVFLMRFDADGKHIDSVKAIDLGVNVVDPEALTFDGTHYYSISSQSKPKAVEGVGLARFKFDNQSHNVSGVESLHGLKDFLVQNVAELRELGNTKDKDGGINIEGLAWDARQKRFLVGLRSPVVDGHALIVPIRFRDPKGNFSIENLEVEGSKAIRLPLGGVGIRGIEYDKQTKNYQLISGAAENQEQADFGIWEWNGDTNQAVVREIKKFDKSLKPEGVARVTVGEKHFTLVVFDTSGYTTID